MYPCGGEGPDLCCKEKMRKSNIFLVKGYQHTFLSLVTVFAISEKVAQISHYLLRE